MRTEVFLDYSPVTHADWWKKHVQYSKFNRQGIDITCASFEHANKAAKANIIFLTGWNETFLKYNILIETLYDNGYNVYTYDHQSQGLSERWLTEIQSTWVNTFDDYVDDFCYFVSEYPEKSMPNYVLTHSMGGLIAAIAMSRFPSLINRACLCAPMFRNKCGMKCFDFKYPLPQPVAYWLTFISCKLGLGVMHAIGYFKEESADILPLNIYTSDREQLDLWQNLRMKYPNIISCCPTNDWVIQSLKAQNKFAERYEHIKTNVLILSAENDCLVYNRAMAIFVKRAPHCKMYTIMNAYHELLVENEVIRNSTTQIILDYFKQTLDDVQNVDVPVDSVLKLYDDNQHIYSVGETILRSVGLVIATTGILVGLSMLLSGVKSRRLKM